MAPDVLRLEVENMEEAQNIIQNRILMLHEGQRCCEVASPAGLPTLQFCNGCSDHAVRPLPGGARNG